MEVIVNIDISVPDWAARWTPGPSAAPLSAQLAEQIKSAVCRGQLRPGPAYRRFDSLPMNCESATTQ